MPDPMAKFRKAQIKAEQAEWDAAFKSAGAKPRRVAASPLPDDDSADDEEDADTGDDAAEDDAEESDDDTPETPDHRESAKTIAAHCKTINAALDECREHTQGYVARDLARMADRLEGHADRVTAEQAKAKAAATKAAKRARGRRK